MGVPRRVKRRHCRVIGASPLYPQKRKFNEAMITSASGQQATLDAYSITSSTCASRVGEIDKPSARAVLLLTVT